MVAVGYGALENDNAGYGQNTAVGYSALYANVTGFDNSAVGYEALIASSTGTRNTAMGKSALAANTSGSGNTAIGCNALPVDNGVYNTAIGYTALYNTTADSELVAIGTGALANDNATNATTITGFGENAAVGYDALYANVTGFDNSALGFIALAGNTIGENNTASGARALANNTTGSFNTACGTGALYNNMTGSENTAIGLDTLVLLGTDNAAGGSNNIALGNNAGYDYSGNESGNIVIGNNGVTGDNNVIRIGTQGQQTITTIAGIWGGTLPGGQGVPVYVDASGHLGTITSSARFKTGIKSMASDSEALYALRPVTFKYKPAIDPKGTPQYGLIAEDVDKVDPDLVVRDDRHQIYSVRYEAINAMLLNEFLKQHDQVERQDTEIQDLKHQKDALAQRLDELELAVKQLAVNK